MYLFITFYFLMDNQIQGRIQKQWKGGAKGVARAEHEMFKY